MYSLKLTSSTLPRYASSVTMIEMKFLLIPGVVGMVLDKLAKTSMLMNLTQWSKMIPHTYVQ